MTVVNIIEDAEALNAKLAALDLAGRLSFVAGLGGRAVFTTSLGIEDQVITAEIGNHRLPIDVVTLADRPPLPRDGGADRRDRKPVRHSHPPL